MVRAAVLQGLVVLAASVLLAAAEGYSQEARDLTKYPIRFAVIGDRTSEAQVGVYEQIIAEIERLKPEFVITVGDMIEGYTEDAAILDREWQEYLDVLEPLSMPVYFTPGNHDITTDGQLDAYRKWTGSEPYYSFDYDGLHIVVLDNSRSEFTREFPREQIEWLLTDLESSQGAVFTLVFLHRPFCYRTLADNKSDTLHSIYAKYGVDVVFSGHWHRYFAGLYDNVRYVSMGTSGGTTDEIPGDPGFHFTWVTVSDEITIAPIRMNAILPWDEIDISEVRAYETARGLGIAFTQAAPVAEDALTVAASTIGVDIHNFDTEFPLLDTVDWKVPEGWTVEPGALPIEVGPGGTAHVTFQVSCGGSLYPLPELCVDFPYGAHGTVRVEKEVRVARKTAGTHAGRPPIIDGVIEESIWQTGHGRLLEQDGSPAKTDSAAFYFAYDEGNLYIAAHCIENRMDSLHASLTEHDAAIYGEDCVGFLYRPGGGQGPVYQLYVSPIGTTFDQQIEQQSDGHFAGDLSWDGTYSVSTSSGDGYWAVEIQIPLAQFGVRAASGQAWDFNFRRKQHRLNAAGGWQVPHAYDPNGFGKLVFR
ncbi:MAG: metallophosphoesterase [Candidatus Zixiibacteriota bacterium]|nr:MAG: metallophosphoesterase [candidate division Zixibacteria bacterium]